MARSVAECTSMMEVLVAGFTRRDRPNATVGTAWADRCQPLVGERIREAGALLNARPMDFPLPTGLGEAFMGEVADVHRDLFAENAESYGQGVRAKIERCLALGNQEIGASRRARAAYADRCLAAMESYDLLLVPTLAFVAPPLPDDEREVRELILQFTFPFNALGWPALALPAGAAEDGLPASLQLVGRPGDDALVLAAGEALEIALGAAGRTEPG